MRIAIISDTHDHMANCRSAITYCNAYGVQLLIHCGDLISPFMLMELERFNGPVHLIYGNNVGDQHLISQRCGTTFTTITHHGLLGAVEADGVRFAFHHLPHTARMIANQGDFDVVCCGHTHRYKIEEIGDVLLVNPGDLHGGKEQPGFVIYDTTSRLAERVDIGVPFFPDEM